MEPIGDFEYSKKDLIGHGAFAVVFKGRHKKKHDFIVAIKCITKKNLAKSQNLLSKEIKILRELSGLQHENVVALLDCKETSHHVYLVMEYCNGGDLADYLQAKGTLSEDTIAAFLKQIAGAMRALNAKGIVHRDLKPQNILLCHSEVPKPKTQPSEIRLKIADFGFARFLQDGVMAATLCGSPMYMAPEVIMSIQYDAKADLWSVGTIVYQCLTGKAPFQAQTPQQLKMFYERNSDLKPNIPPGTSHELRDLLFRLLKRSAKDRIEFDDFFNHAFMNPPKTSPMPVPRTRSRVSMEGSPPVKTISASPLSGLAFHTPPSSQPEPSCRPRATSSVEPMDVGQSSGSGVVMTTPRTTSPAEDFVMVPDNVPSDQSGGSTSSAQKHPSSVDLNAIFSERAPESPRLGARGVRFTPATGAATYHRAADGGSSSPSPVPGTSSPRPGTSSPRPGTSSPRPGTSSPRPGTSSPRPGGEERPDSLRESPSRPSTLAVQSPVASPPSTLSGAAAAAPSSSQPIPVPSQVKAYEQIQRSMGFSPSSPGQTKGQTAESPRAGLGSLSPQGVPIPTRKDVHKATGSLPSVESMSPPRVQFSIGTPPSNTWRRASISSTPPPSGSPHRRPGSTPPRVSTTPNLAIGAMGGFPLPTILGSPTKTPGVFQFSGAGVGTAQSPVFPADGGESPSSPLHPPFGVPFRSRAKTCPDNIAAVGYNPETAHRATSPGKSVVPVAMEMFPRSGSTGRLSEQLLMAAFGAPNPGSTPGLPIPPRGSSSGQQVVPYSGSSASLHHAGSTASLGGASGELGWERPPGGRPRTCSGCGGLEDSSPSSMPYAQSPPNMEGPITFVAPELVEETLMDKEHNETVSKLSFVLALVECIIELAQSRSSPLSESFTADHPQHHPHNREKGGEAPGGGPARRSLFTLDPIAFLSESQRRVEQLLLYVRALQLLTSAISLAKNELKGKRLQPSNAVKNMLSEMNHYYHQCLVVCRNLNNQGVLLSPDASPQAAVTADKLIYSYAIEMCQTAALDELFGNPEECFRRYRNAQVLLHSLAQQTHNEHDRQLLNKYKESVEKRLFALQSSGAFAQAYESS